jgi:predicted membrane protein
VKNIKIRLNNKTKIYLSIISLIFGLLLIFQQYSNYNIPLWPLFLVFTGLFLFYPYLEDKKQYNTIIPSLIMILTGIYIFINTSTNWKFLGQTWPVFLLIVSFSFYIYYFAAKNRSLLAASNLLIVLFFILMLISNIKSRFWAIIFFVIPIFIIVEMIFNKNKI